MLDAEEKPKYAYGVFVKGLPGETSRDDFDELAHALVPEAVAVLRWNMAGYFRGFGFVYVPTQADQELMIQALNGHQYGGRQLIAEVMRPKEVVPQ